MTAFYLIKGTRQPGSWPSIIIAFICAILAFGTKESSLVLPIAFLTLRGKKIKIAATIMLVVSIIFLVIPRIQAKRLGSFPARKIAVVRVMQEGSPEEMDKMKTQSKDKFDVFLFRQNA